MKLELPPQPEIVRDWIAARNAAQREIFAIIDDVAINGATIEEVMSLDLSGLVNDSLRTPPAEVANAYKEWAAEYNAIVHEHNERVRRHRTELQAKRNAAEVRKVRSQACPRCFASHAGEC